MPRPPKEAPLARGLYRMAGSACSGRLRFAARACKRMQAVMLEQNASTACSSRMQALLAACAALKGRLHTKRRAGSVPYYSLEILSGRPPFPEGVDPTKRELYLSDEVFRQVCARLYAGVVDCCPTVAP